MLISFLFLQENMLWVLIRSASNQDLQHTFLLKNKKAGEVLLMSTHNTFSWRNRTNIYLAIFLIWSHKVPKALDKGAEVIQGPVFQNIVSLTRALVVKMLTVQVSTISNSQLFLLKNVSSFCICKRFSHFFSKNISIYAIFNDQS